MQLESSKKTISESKIREQSYVERLSDLEIQLQREKSRTTQPEEKKHSEEIEILTKTINNLVEERKNFELLINERASI